MNLREFCEKTKIPYRKIAQNLGMKHITLYQVLNGANKCSLKLACKLNVYSKGLIEITDMLSKSDYDEIYGSREK